MTQYTAAPQVTAPVTQQQATGPAAAISPLAGSGAVNAATSGGQAGNTGSQSSSSAGQPQAGTGSLSVATTPAGAAVFIDGVQRGVSPATIPGLAAGSHTIVLRLAGYQDLSAPVSITAGIQNEFSTGLTPLAAGTVALPATTEAGVASLPAHTQTPGFEAAAAITGIGAFVLLRRS